MQTTKVKVSPYNAAWKSDFEKIKTELEDILSGLIVRIEHVGSTSVEGMWAKPCIDIDVVIKDYSVFDKIVAELEKQDMNMKAISASKTERLSDTPTKNTCKSIICMCVRNIPKNYTGTLHSETF